MPATLIFKCESNGFLFDYPTELTEGDEQDIPAFVAGFATWLAEKGINPIKSAAAPQRTAPSGGNGGGNNYNRGSMQERGYGNNNRGGGGNNGGGYNRNNNNGGNTNRYARQDDDWECPVHGREDVGPGFRGNGVECKVFSDYADEWTKSRPSVMRNGDERYYCRHSSTNRG